MTAVLADHRELSSSLSAFATFQQGHLLSAFSAQVYQRRRQAGLADQRDASYFHDRGFLLPISKTNGLSMVGIHTGKALTVFVKQCDLPVTVSAPFVFFKRWFPSNFHFSSTSMLGSLLIRFCYADPSKPVRLHCHCQFPCHYPVGHQHLSRQFRLCKEI